MGNRKRRYHPDIFVIYHDGRVFVEEVKGWIPNRVQFIKKKLMAELWCKRKGYTYRVVYEKDLESLF